MTINSRQKGAAAEREVAHWLQDRGVTARRGQQFSGGKDSPDVVSSLPNVHLEVKRTEHLSLYVALAQAIAESGEGEVPVVLHRRNKMEWVAILRATDWLALLLGRRGVRLVRRVVRLRKVR